MKLSYPVFLDVTPIVVSFTDGLSEEGEENIVGTFTGKCIFSSKTKYVRDSDGHMIQLLGKAIMGCDIAPDRKLITGKAAINGKEYNIYQSSRPNNPDGTVHHTELELI